MIFDPLYFIILAPALLLSLWAQWKVKSAYHKASRIAASSGLTGAAAARRILDSNNLQSVSIEMTQGTLSDHYDPRHKVLRLSPDVHSGRSLASLGIAAHEAGHAIQDATNYAPLVIRNGVVPLASIGSNMAIFIFIIGMFLGGAANAMGMWLMWGAIALFSVVVFFQLVNLPVEFDASSRARRILSETGMVAGAEEREVGKVLNAAALTYVAATLTAILTLAYFILRATARR